MDLIFGVDTQADQGTPPGSEKKNSAEEIWQPPDKDWKEHESRAQIKEKYSIRMLDLFFAVITNFVSKVVPDYSLIMSPFLHFM